MARLTKKESLIKKIKTLIEEWGSFNISEVEHEGSPVVKRMGKDSSQCIDSFDKNGVGTTIYVHEIETETEDIDYEDLSVEILEDVLRIVELYEVDMQKTMDRCKD